jgi:hypothetical protein
MYLSERDQPTRRARIADAGQKLTELVRLLDQPDSEEYRRAMQAADLAVNNVIGKLHFNTDLAPVIAHAAERVLPSRRLR